MSAGRKIILLGPTCVGKSTIANAIKGEVWTTSGTGFGGGITKKCMSTILESGLELIDAPSYVDSNQNYLKGVGDLVADVLRKNGTAVIIFVLQLESGRLKRSDVMAMEMLAKSIADANQGRPIGFTVLLNRMSKAQRTHWDNDEKLQRTKTSATLNQYFTALLKVLNWEEDLDCFDNGLMDEANTQIIHQAIAESKQMLTNEKVRTVNFEADMETKARAEALEKKIEQLAAQYEKKLIEEQLDREKKPEEIRKERNELKEKLRVEENERKEMEASKKKLEASYEEIRQKYAESQKSVNEKEEIIRKARLDTSRLEKALSESQKSVNEKEEIIRNAREDTSRLQKELSELRKVNESKGSTITMENFNLLALEFAGIATEIECQR